jgi:hypothetical protein
MAWFLRGADEWDYRPRAWGFAIYGEIVEQNPPSKKRGRGVRGLAGSAKAIKIVFPGIIQKIFQ